MNKFTRERIQEIIRSGAGLDTVQARVITARIISALASSLAAGETVELRGLGSLEVRKHAERRMRNPLTGETVIVPARRYVFFTPGRDLKAAVNVLQEPAPET
jgi:nucleoid DNA-binding protein